MKLVLDFLSLRPVFPRTAFLVIWCVYLAATIMQVGQYAILLLTTGTIYSGLTPHYYISLLPPILFALTNLALVRIFLEIAQKYLIERDSKASRTSSSHS